MSIPLRVRTRSLICQVKTPNKTSTVIRVRRATEGTTDSASRKSLICATSAILIELAHWVTVDKIVISARDAGVTSRRRHCENSRQVLDMDAKVGTIGAHIGEKYENLLASLETQAGEDSTTDEVAQ